MKLEKVVDRARAGDKEAFVILIKEYQDCLYNIAKSRLKNEDDVCDAVQNALILAYKSIGNLREAKYFKTWLIKILINCCNNIYWRYGKNEVSLEEIEDYKLLDNNDFSNKFDIDYLIESLSPNDQTILVLYYKEGYKEKEIAKIMEMNYATVRTKISRAKQKIASILDKGEV